MERSGYVYSIADNKRVSPFQYMPKKGELTMVPNEKNGIIPMRSVTGWRVCMDYKKLNIWKKKDHFLLPFVQQMLDCLGDRGWYYFLMVIRVTFKFILLINTNIRPLSLIHIGLSFLRRCLLICAIDSTQLTLSNRCKADVVNIYPIEVEVQSSGIV